MWRWGLLWPALLLLLLGAPSARAQALPEIDTYPLNIVADGRGALQITVDGHGDGEFQPARAKPAVAGLELRENDAYSIPGDDKREVVDEPKLSGDGRTLTSRYTIGPSLEISETIVGADVKNIDSDIPRVRMSYAIKNLTGAPITFDAAEIAPVSSPVDGNARGIQGVSPGPFIGTLDRIGRRVALEQVTKWDRTQVGPVESVRANFRTGGGLDNSLGDGFTNAAVGAQWRRTVAPGESTTITVDWGIDVYRSVYFVDSTADHDDGACAGGDCTLREAIRYVPQTSEIKIPKGRFPLRDSQIGVDHSLTLTGEGARATILDGNGAARYFDVRAGAQLDLNDVTLTGGTGEAGGTLPGPFERAAAVPPGNGGAVSVQAGATLNLNAVTVTGNDARLNGGGIASEGALSVYASTIANNRAAGGSGGGIAASVGSLFVQDATVSGNSAPTGSGGGILTSVPTQLWHATIAANRAEGGGGVTFAAQDGVQTRSTLFAQNTPVNCASPGADETSGSLSDDLTCGLTGEGDAQGVDALLDKLADNGGPTDTHALKPGSPAVDAGDPKFCLSVDQRGEERMIDGHCDIGAYEAPSESLESPGRIVGGPLEATADGLGRLQLRREDDARDVFASGGMAFFTDGLYFPAGGPDVTDTTGSRTPMSGPTATITGAGGRQVQSVYYVGASLEVTETVSYALGDRGVKARYAIRNTSTKPVDFRAAELATVNTQGNATAGDSVGVIAGDGSGTRIEQGSNPWTALQAGAGGGALDVYDAFAHSGLKDQIADGADTDQLGVEWKVEGLKPDDTRVLDLVWTVADATAEVVVTTTQDGPQANCTADACTLRAALTASPAGSVIRVPKGDYQLTSPLTSSENHIVRGDGADQTVLRAGKDARVLSVTGGALGLSGVRVTGGNPKGEGADGGGILVSPGASLALANARVDHNTTTGSGGGLYLGGPASITNSTIDANTSLRDPDNEGLGGVGGGLSAQPLSPLSLVNVTISGNRAEQFGGGVDSEWFARLTNVTITDNTAPVAAGYFHVASYGRKAPSVAPDFLGADLAGVIIAGNHGPSACAGDMRLQSRFSLADDGTCMIDTVIGDAGVGALAANGGPTPTHALTPTSPAVNLMADARCALRDQRGGLRPANGNCDAGAFERTGPEPPAITAPAEGALLNSTTVQLGGTAPAGATVEVSEGGQPLGSDVASGTGAWLVELTGLSQGAHTFAVTQGSSEPALRTITVDTLPPPAPSLNAIVDGATVTLTGAVVDSVGATLFDGQTALGALELTGGEFSRVLQDVAVGVHAYRVVARDAAGNTAESVREVTVTAPAPPATPAFTVAAAGSTVTLAGTAPGAATVELFEGTASLGVVGVATDGSWTKTLENVAPGEHAYTAVARNAAGGPSAPSGAKTVTVAQVALQTPAPTPAPPGPPAPGPTPTPTPTPSNELPPPVVGKDVNVEVKTGRVLLKVPGANRFVELVAGQKIPLGTIVDATKGHVTLTSAGARGVLETAEFYAGIFKVSQTKGAKPVTVVTLAEKLSCPKKGKAASAAAKKKKTRKLWGSGKGNFRTAGHYSAATVRGTRWLVQDTCTTTLTKVTQGVVEVRDNVRRKTVLVRPGKPYTARARRR